MSAIADRQIDDYLKRLRSELRGVPRVRRKEIVADITAHIAEGRAQVPDETVSEIRSLLDRLGDPTEIAAEELPQGTGRRSRWQEPAAIALLLLGGFVFLVGWIAGVVLLWTSDRWTTVDKLIGTFVLPGGLLASFYVFGSWVVFGSARIQDCMTTDGRDVCSSSTSAGGQPLWATGVIAVLLLSPLVTTLYLSLRDRNRSALAR